MSKGISSGGVIQRGNVGEQLAPAVAVVPTLQAAGALNGSIIDRLRINSGVFHIFTGALSGTPYTSSVAYKIQHDTDSAFGTPVDATAGRFGGVSGTIADPANAKTAELACDLEHLNRYVRLVVTPALAGGSAPKVQVAASFVPGEYRGEMPAA